MLPLSPVSTISLYLENKLSMPLSPIHTNYPKIIINNGPGSPTAADVKKSFGYKAVLQLTLALIKH